jgi:hypothetical protein
MISSSQGPLLTQDNTIYKHKDKHPRLERDSNPRSQQPSGQDLRPRGHRDHHYVRIYICLKSLMIQQYLLKVIWDQWYLDSNSINRVNKWWKKERTQCSLQNKVYDLIWSRKRSVSMRGLMTTLARPRSVCKQHQPFPNKSACCGCEGCVCEGSQSFIITRVILSTCSVFTLVFTPDLCLLRT